MHRSFVPFLVAAALFSEPSDLLAHAHARLGSLDPQELEPYRDLLQVVDGVAR